MMTGLTGGELDGTGGGVYFVEGGGWTGAVGTDVFWHWFRSVFVIV